MKDIVLYEDYISLEMFEETKQMLFECNADAYGWKSVDDVPETRVWEAINDQCQEDWELFAAAIKAELKQHSFILTGKCGRWNGPAICGAFIRSFDDLMKGLRHLDSLKFYDHNGHLYIEGCHHDGSDFYEMRRLTNKGLELAEKHSYAHDCFLHQTLMKYNFYSTLPKFGKAYVGF